MNSALGQRFEMWARKHSAGMLVITLVVAVVSTLLLLARSEGTVVLYQAF